MNHLTDEELFQLHSSPHGLEQHKKHAEEKIQEYKREMLRRMREFMEADKK